MLIILYKQLQWGALIILCIIGGEHLIVCTSSRGNIDYYYLIHLKEGALIILYFYS